MSVSADNEFEAEELELLLEAYSAELKEIEHELKNVGEINTTFDRTSEIIPAHKISDI